MRRTDAGAGEHRDRELRDHPEVDVDPVTLADPERAQPVREPADLFEQLAVRDGARVAGLPLPVVRDLVPAAGPDVAIQAVDGGVQLPAGEPGHPRCVPDHHRVPRTRPGQLASLLGPEGLVIGVRAVVDRRDRPRSRCSRNRPEGSNTPCSDSRASMVRSTSLTCVSSPSVGAEGCIVRTRRNAGRPGGPRDATARNAEGACIGVRTAPPSSVSRPMGRLRSISGKGKEAADGRRGLLHEVPREARVRGQLGHLEERPPGDAGHVPRLRHQADEDHGHGRREGDGVAGPYGPRTELSFSSSVQRIPRG